MTGSEREKLIEALAERLYRARTAAYIETGSHGWEAVAEEALRQIEWNRLYRSDPIKKGPPEARVSALIPPPITLAPEGWKP